MSSHWVPRHNPVSIGHTLVSLQNDSRRVYRNGLLLTTLNGETNRLCAFVDNDMAGAVAAKPLADLRLVLPDCVADCGFGYGMIVET